MWKKSCEDWKKIYLFISNEDVNDVIKIVKSLEDSGIFIDGVNETVKHKKKNISSVAKDISGRRVWKAGRGYMGKKIYFCSIL